MRHDLVVSVDRLERQGDTGTFSFAKSVIDNAPSVAGRPLSNDGRRKLEEHYPSFSGAA
jgi:hypothetical protein